MRLPGRRRRDEAGDDDDAEDPDGAAGRDRPAPDGGPEPETSAGRGAGGGRKDGGAGGDARRRLADRVGGTGGGAKERRRPSESGRRGADAGASGEKAANERGGEGDEAKPRLNRPRRQPDRAAAAAAKDRAKDGGRKGAGSGKRDGDRKRGEGGERSKAGKRREGEAGKRHEGDGGKRREGDGGKRRRSGATASARRDRERSRRARSRSAGRRMRAAGAAAAAAAKRGAIGAGRWSAAAAPEAGRKLLAGLGAVFAVFFAVLGSVIGVLLAVFRRIARPLGAVLRALDRAARAVSRRATPARVLTVVVAGAAILLALSQYADYRVVSIDGGDYADVQSLAPAPETGRAQTGDPHSYILVPVAIACLLLLAVATIGERWRACRLIALAGFAAIVVALLVDRPAGLDPGDAAVAFEGATAKLIGGFYAEIAAGILLIGASSMLARELRPAAETSRTPAGGTAGRRAARPGRRHGAAGSRGPARA